MRQQRLRQGLAEFIIDGGTTGRHTVTAAIPAERTEEGAMRGAGVHAVQAVDDVQSLLVGSSALMGSGSLAFASEPLLLIPSGMQVAGSKPWFCIKKTIRFGTPVFVGDAKTLLRVSEEPNAAPTPAAVA